MNVCARLVHLILGLHAASGGCSADGCTADQFEWATDQAAAAYIAGGGTVPTEDVANFLLECAQVMGYETILPSSLE